MIEYGALGVAVLAFLRGLRRAAVALACFAVSGILRPALAPLRAGYERPYTGAGLALFLATEVALFTVPPAGLMWSLGWRWSAVALWCVSTGAVALGYPDLRGLALLRFYAALYLSAYAVTSGVTFWRAARADRMTLDQLGQLVLCACGTASTILVLAYGPEMWDLTHITSGAGIATLLALSLLRREGPRGGAQRR